MIYHVLYSNVFFSDTFEIKVLYALIYKINIFYILY